MHPTHFTVPQAVQRINLGGDTLAHNTLVPASRKLKENFMINYNLERFYEKHMLFYPVALSEIQKGKKQSCWMWYIFPQLKKLGKSSTAIYFGIENAEEAKLFYEDLYLGANLREISSALLQCESSDPFEVMFYPDNIKLRSSMTLFYLVTGDEVFKKVLDKFYSGELDEETVKYLSK